MGMGMNQMGGMGMGMGMNQGMGMGINPMGGMGMNQGMGMGINLNPQMGMGSGTYGHGQFTNPQYNQQFNDRDQILRNKIDEIYMRYDRNGTGTLE